MHYPYTYLLNLKKYICSVKRKNDEYNYRFFKNWWAYFCSKVWDCLYYLIYYIFVHNTTIRIFENKIMFYLATAFFILLGSLVCTYGKPVIFKDVMEQLCSDDDDYLKLEDDVIPDILALVKEMVGVLSTGLEKLKNHYVSSEWHWM